MQISGRNQLKASIRSIKRGAVMAEVVMALGDGQELVAAITLSSVERLGLREGEQVIAIVKATEVMVGKE